MARKQSGISQQPYLNHDIKTQGQQARFLDSTPEQVRNLGHPTAVDRLTENPVGYPLDYQSPSAARVINETRSQGVYGRFRDPQSGIAQQNNLDRWAGYAKANSYTGHHHKAGVCRCGDDGSSAFDVLHASPMHKAALLYLRPICTTSHDATITAKPPEKGLTDGFALAPQTMPSFRENSIAGAVEPGSRSNPRRPRSRRKRRGRPVR
jgi:hypothetical protein